ncbi:hypothetical protein Acsp02_19280 [Actinoplanes sp. NBRC 103695]|nr:hypothetical protein Acsp02_19280 [Actinoplanes sp. NBRC 103695]
MKAARSRAGAAASSGSQRIRPRQPIRDSSFSRIETKARRRPSPYRVAGSRLTSASQGVRCRPASISADSARGAPIASGSAAMVCPVSRRTRSAPVTRPVTQIASRHAGTTATPAKKVTAAACNDTSRPRSGRNTAFRVVSTPALSRSLARWPDTQLSTG